MTTPKKRIEVALPSESVNITSAVPPPFVVAGLERVARG